MIHILFHGGDFILLYTRANLFYHYHCHRRTDPGSKCTVTLENEIGNCHCWTTADGISATAITDMEYPERAAFILLNNLLLDCREYFAADPSMYQEAVVDMTGGKLPYPNMTDMIKKWQDPHEADKLMKVEKELFEVKEVMH